MNPLYQMIGNNQYTGLIRQFQQFRDTFKGDPRQQIQQMLNSGKISQQQYNQAVQQADAFQKMLEAMRNA